MKKIVLLALVLVLLSTAVFVGFMRPVVAQGTIYIKADGSVEGTVKIQRDGNVYTFIDNIFNQSIVVERDNIVVDGGGYIVQGTGSGNGINLAGRSNVTIKNMAIKNFDYGIFTHFSSNNVISGNIITANNARGIWLQESSSNIISGNIITSNSGLGIAISDSEHNEILDNTLSNNGHGIWLLQSCNNLIDGNNACYNGQGISMDSFSNNNTIANNVANNNSWGGILLSNNCSNNVVTDNVVSYNGQTGVMIAPYSCGNVISGNTLVGNTCGIGFWGNSSNNAIYHNNFVNNAERAGSMNSTNVWDGGYPSGGNYWSDYAGVDLYSGLYQNETGSDGIGDTSHVIDANNTDRYPLMGPINFFKAGTWDKTTYYVDTVTNSTVSDFYFNEDNKLISFNVTGTDDTVGFCRITIPNELLWCDNPEQWEVWVNNTLTENRKIMEDTNYTYIYFTYNQSTQNVEVIGVHVIPEFPTWTSMLLILILLTVAIAIYKRRLLKTQIH